MATAGATFDVDPKTLGTLLEQKKLLQEIGGMENLCNRLKTSITDGLPNVITVLQTHRNYFGENYIPPKMPHNFFYYVFKAIQDYMLIFLLVGGIIVFITEIVKNPSSGGIDGIAIIVAVFIIVLVTSVNDYSKEMKFKNLHKTIKLGNTCTVMRDCQICEISTKDLVVGDIYLPKYGDQVPADAVLFQVTEMKVDESSITGESDLVKKDVVDNPYLLSGTYVMDGSGKALIVAVGQYSQTGRILKLLGVAKKKQGKKKQGQSEPSDDKVDKNEGPKCRSVLQEKLTKLAMLIGKLGLCSGTLVFIILVVRFCISNYTGEKGRGFQTSDLNYFLEALIEGFSVVVVAVPEGLPLAVTLSLAYSVTRMLRDKNLVRQLYSCETMGNATTICSDKTGTLTTNRMTVQEFFTLNTKFTDFTKKMELPPDLIRCLCLNICVNKSPSSMIKDVPGLPPQQMGNKTDCSLLGFLTHLGTSYSDFMLTIPEKDILKVFPFNSEKKLMTAIVRVEGGSGIRVLAKGAPDVLLGKCSYMYVSLQEPPCQMTEEYTERANKVIAEMATEALRTILLASKDIEAIDDIETIDETILVSDMVFLGLAGIEDPIRRDVPDAIKTCSEAGITVRMVTGDNIVTARSIALKCGILHNDTKELILDSKRFNELIKDKDGHVDQDLFDKVWPRLRVLARSSPKDKYVLVNGILNTNLSCKQIVAVTGDGTNDAPALKRADVGFAMGLTGTDIAKEACDIIITDDNFANIVKAILWGRNVYDSISKFIQFQLTVNFSAIILSILAIMFFGKSPLRAIQLLWVNLIMDTLASLALATDLPTNELLKRKPYSRERSLLSRNMVLFLILHVLYQIVVVMLLIFLAPSVFGIQNEFNFAGEVISTESTSGKEDVKHTTFIFNAFVFMQIFNEINARKVHGERNVFGDIFTNKIFLFIFFLTCLIQFIIIQFTYSFFHVEPLSLTLWLTSIGIGVSVLIYHQLVVITLGSLVKIPKKYRIQHGIPSSSVTTEDIRGFDARLLWIRGLKKLQQELRVIEAFRDGLVVKRPTLENPDSSQYYTLMPSTAEAPPT